MSNKIWGIILAISLILVGVSAFNVISIYGEYKKGMDEYTELEEYVTVEETAGTETVQEEDPEEVKEYQIPLKVDVRYEVLESINDDFVSWIYYEPL